MVCRAFYPLLLTMTIINIIRINFYRAKTFVMTTILEEPYMMLKKTKPGGPALKGNEMYEGYCKDLADAITRLTGIQFLIKPVKDGKYGSPDPTLEGGWNGT